MRHVVWMMALVGVVGASVHAQEAPTPAQKAALELDAKIIKEAKDSSEIMKNLQYLSDVIGPRLTGSANLKRANEWTAEVMKKYGLTNVKLEPWTIPVGWERGTATVKMLEPNNGRYLTVASGGWSGSTKGKLTCDVVAVNATNKAELEKYKGKLKGAVVLSRPPSRVPTLAEILPKKEEPKKEEGKTEPKGGKGGNFGDFAFRREVAEFVRSEGAAVILSDSGKPHNLLVTTGGWRSEERANAPEPIPQLFVAHEHYMMLHRLASVPDAKVKVEVEISNKLVPGPITVYNTVGEIEGEIKDEFVVVGAHLDSWDLAQGTTDNGTGSCIVLEAARLIVKSGVKPKRTIRFVLFTGEEQGLHGSKQYVIRHKDEMAKTSVALVHDTGTGKVLGFGLQGREAIKPIMDQELVSLKAVDFLGVTLRSMNGTDHQSFEAVGVPGFACAQDRDEYFLTHHTPSDTFDKAKEPNLIQGAQVMAVTATRVANLGTLLPRQRPKKEESKKEQPKKEEPKKDQAPEILDVKPRENR